MQLWLSEKIYKSDKLPVFFVDDIYKEKYVDLEQNCNSDCNSEGE